MQLVLMIKKLKRNETGALLIEVLVAMAIMGVVAVAFLTGLGTATKATVISNEQATAESLIRSEMEYIKNSGYQASYTIDAGLTIPAGWTMPAPGVQTLETGLQKVTVSAQRSGETILSIVMYKVDR